MSPSRTWMSVLVALAACGCGGRARPELLESRLRQQEDALRQAQVELSDARNQLHVARQESQALREQLQGQGQVALLPEQADSLFRATGIRVHKLLTGGLDRDGKPGDDALNVAVTPHDAQGSPVKIPGTVRLELLDMAQPESLRRVGLWEFRTDESARHWQSNFLGSGYRFQLPWQTPPAHPELLLHARLVTTDGRQFDVTHPVRVTPAATATAAVPTEPPSLSGVGMPPTAGDVHPAAGQFAEPQPLELKPLRDSDRKPDVSRLWETSPRTDDALGEPLPFPGIDDGATLETPPWELP